MRRRALIFLPLSLVVLRAAFAQEKRCALVVGNAAYREQPLKNPVNDARAVGAALQQLGFQVALHENTSLRDLITALQRFSIDARQCPVRIVFYAGHGMQVKGRNFLIPVDAQISSVDDVPRVSADVGDLLERLSDTRQGLNIVILDACRSNPFNNQSGVDAGGRRIRTRALGDVGLARIDAPNGTLVAYSTAPGTVAMDSANEPNSVFTKHLLANLTTPGQSIEQLFKRIRIAVANETQQLQVPWEASSLVGEFCFVSGPAQKCGA